MSRLAILTAALRASFASPRAMADVCGCTPQSAWRYMRGDYVPNIVTLALLMRHSRSVAVAFWEYVGLDHASLDAESARLRADFADLQTKFEALDAEYQRLLAARAKPMAAVAGVADQRADAAAPAADTASPPR